MTPATVVRSALLALSVLTLSALAGAPATLAQTAPQPGPAAPAPTSAPAQRQANPIPANPIPANPGRATTPAAPRQANPGQASGQAAQAPAPVRRGAGRRARVPYAVCNRQAHARGLRGGARRRFLIRCKLGYETPRPPQAAPARQP
jgi:hypothetical protein